MNVGLIFTRRPKTLLQMNNNAGLRFKLLKPDIIYSTKKSLLQSLCGAASVPPKDVLQFLLPKTTESAVAFPLVSLFSCKKLQLLKELT